MEGTHRGFPVWLIAVVAGVGGLILLASAAAILRWQIRRRRQTLYADDEFGPTRQLAIRRGRVVPAAWNMSIGHSILGMRTHNASFTSLDENLTGTGRRSIRNVFKKRSSRRSSMTSQLSKPAMTEARKSTLSPTTRAENQELLQDVDEAFVLKSPKPTFSRTNSVKTSYSLPSIINARELSHDNEGQNQSEIDAGSDASRPSQRPSPAAGTARKPSSSQRNSSTSAVPKSKYTSRQQSSSKFNGREPSSPHTSRVTRHSKLASVTEDSTSASRAGSQDSGPVIPRRKGSVKRNLKPLAVPAPVLSSATSAVKRTSKIFPSNTSSLVPLSPKRRSNLVPSPQPSPKQPSPSLPPPSLQTIQQPYQSLQPPLRSSPLEPSPLQSTPSAAATPWDWQDPPPTFSNPPTMLPPLQLPPLISQTQLSTSPHTTSSPTTRIPLASVHKSYRKDSADNASPSLNNPSSPATFSTRTEVSVAGGSSRRSSNYTPNRTTSKKGNVLRKKSLQQAERVTMVGT